MQSRAKLRVLIVAAVTTVGLLGSMLPAHAVASVTIIVAGKCDLAQHIVAPALVKKKGMTIAAQCTFGNAATKAARPFKPNVLIVRQTDVAKDYVSGKLKEVQITCVDLGPSACPAGLTVNATVQPGPTGLGPHAGHSSGTFTGTLGNVVVSGTYISAGSVLVLTGMITHHLQTGPCAGVVDATPDLTGSGPMPLDPTKPPQSTIAKPPGAASFYVVGGLKCYKVGPISNPLQK